MSDLTASSVMERAVHALRDSSVTTFTRAQVAYLVEHLATVVDVAYRMGYQFGHSDGQADATSHITELNLDALRAGYDARPFSSVEIATAASQQRARDRADSRAPSPYAGGPVAEWDADCDPMPVPAGSMKVVRGADGLRWAV
jgi:hypothetical protein